MAGTTGDGGARRPPADGLSPGDGLSGEDGGRGLQVFEFDAGCCQDHVAGDVHDVLLTRVQGADLVFVHHQRAIVSGMRFTLHQGPGLIESAGGEDWIREGDEADPRRGGTGGETQETCGGDEESGGCAGEGVGADIAFGGMGAGGVGTDPGDAVEGGTADLPARGVKFETDGAAEFVDGQVDGAGMVAGGGGDLRDIAPAGGAGGALEVFFAEGV